MSRFVIEHLPRNRATYEVTPLRFEQVETWLRTSRFTSLIRTTELMAAIDVGMGVTLSQSDTSMALKPGDEALLITLSFGVLLAWAEGKIPPLSDDWRCLLLRVEADAEPSSGELEAALPEDVLLENPI